MSEKWLDADQTAASLQITKATLYKLVKDGQLPAEKVNGKWRFARADIEELFATAGAHPAWGGSEDKRA